VVQDADRDAREVVAEEAPAVPQHAELEGEAEALVVAAAAVDLLQVLGREPSAAGELVVGRVDGKGEGSSFGHARLRRGARMGRNCAGDL